MMGNFDDLFTGFVIICALFGAAVMAVVFWVVPWLWSLIKPLLHAVTA